LKTQVKYLIIDSQTYTDEKIRKEKFKLFINYLKITWIPRFQDGMLDYASINKGEWTNNALESYHKRFQEKLTK